MSTKEKAQELANFWQELVKNDNGFTYNKLDSVKHDLGGPNKHTKNISEYIVNPPKPIKKTIDLPMMINSGIDIEFGNNTDKWFIDKLMSIYKNGYYHRDSNNYSTKCRIRQNHWHSWDGEYCPIPEGLLVSFKTANSLEYTFNNIINYRELDWSIIIAFMVTGTRKDYAYEWQDR